MMLHYITLYYVILSGGTTCAMLLVQWDVLHKVVFQVVAWDTKKNTKRNGRHCTSSVVQVAPPPILYYRIGHNPGAGGQAWRAISRQAAGKTQSSYVCMHIYIYTYVYIYIYICVCLSLSIYIYIYTHILHISYIRYIYIYTYTSFALLHSLSFRIIYGSSAQRESLTYKHAYTHTRTHAHQGAPLSQAARQ